MGAAVAAGEDEEQEEGEGEDEDLAAAAVLAGGVDHELSRAESAASAASFWAHLLRESWAELQVWGR